MRVYTAHERGGAWRFVPLESGFWSGLWALIFGPLWLIAHRALAVGLAVLAAELLLIRLAGIGGAAPFADAGLWTITFGVAIFGQDLRRAELALGGFRSIGPVAAADADAALLRMLGADAQPLGAGPESLGAGPTESLGAGTKSLGAGRA